MADRLTMQDPRDQYPRPPFPEQPQPAPGPGAVAPAPNPSIRNEDAFLKATAEAQEYRSGAQAGTEGSAQ